MGPYELLLELASGGMATVFLARATDGRVGSPLVALKRPHRHLASDKNFLAMLLDEARLASAIAHENVVKVREMSFHEGEPFIVMDYVEGASLSEMRKELASAERAFDLKIALRIVLDALAGLHAAHELCDAGGKPLDIVHRDISPHNILVGSDGRARLTDFGIAHASDRLQSTRTHEIKGKLAYLSPERVDRRRICTRQSDVFSMAVVLWECLAGRRLFRGEEAVDTLQEVMHAPIPRLRQIGREISPALDDVIARALSRDLAIRFATALEFASALVDASGPGSIGEADQVARLIEALYGARIAECHQRVRAVLKDDHATELLFETSGFSRSPSTPPALGNRADALRDFAPPAPSERYAFGEGLSDARYSEGRRMKWMLALGVLAGIAVGGAATFMLARRGSAPAVALTMAALPPVAASASGWTSASTAPSNDEAASLSAARRVTIPLPYLAAEVTVDGVVHDLSPAADVLAVDFPLSADSRHHVVVTALDGSRSQSDVREQAGVAQAVSPGFVPARAGVPSGSAPPSVPASRGVGVVRNGFTKLK